MVLLSPVSFTKCLSAIGILSLTLCLGCVSAPYNAANLPPEFTARPLSSARHLDLSSLSFHDRPSELLQPGDSVSLTIVTGIEADSPTKWDLRIREDGLLDIPLVGTVPIAGIAANEAEGRIRDESIRRGLFISPKVTLRVADRRTYRITVAGAVMVPGTYDIPAGDCDVLAALTQAKGLAEDAGTVVEVRHPAAPIGFTSMVNADGTVSQVAAQGPGPQRMAFDIANAKSLPPDQLKLHDGSVVSVNRQPKRAVNVLGLVRTPTQVDIPPGEDLMLLDAIAQAGGTTISFADKVQVVRRLPNNPQPIVIGVSLREARNGSVDNLRLAPGDLVSVEETAVTMVVDTVRTFFRVGFSAALPGI